MQLKEYQIKVLERFDRYLGALGKQEATAAEIAELLKSKNREVPLSNCPREAWEELHREGLIPGQGGGAVGYMTRLDGLDRSIPNVCLKIPTGGGKTLLATLAVERVQTDYLKQQRGFVLWVVPSEAIYRQTWKALANREHPYRQMLERASGGRVKMLEKSDQFNNVDTQTYLCVMLLMLQSSARATRETLRMFKDSGKFTTFFPPEDDHEANYRLLESIPNLDQNDLADLGYADGVVPGSLSIKQSLGNTLKLLRPIIVIDEGHKAYSETARETLCGFNPRFLLELSATPNPGGNHHSNVLVDVSGSALKDECMIKLPINIEDISNVGWQHTLAAAYGKLADLTLEAEKVQAREGRYIRPILLVRVERTGKDQRDSGLVHAEDAREYLLEKCGVLEEAIRVKSSERDELGDEDLLSETSPVTIIITKDALREGWDCPFAYVLAILSNTTANTALTQMIGRVLRQPYAIQTGSRMLNESYVFTFDQDVAMAVQAVRAGLQEEGMGDLASSVRAVSAGGTTMGSRVEKVNRRDKFKDLPPILLPQILASDSNVKGGYRLLDYERDILGKLDWDQIHFDVSEFIASDMDAARRTMALVDIEHGSGEHTDFADIVEAMGNEEIEEALDFPFLVRQLTELIPNPWQGARVLEETLERLRDEGWDDKKIFLNRIQLLSALKIDVKKQLYGSTTDTGSVGLAEALFREKLAKGEISFHLMSANNPDLDWRLADTLEVEVTPTDTELRRRDGTSLERSLFERVYSREFNELEKNTAWYLDGRESVYWWHRIAVRQGSYGLQGWQRHRVYPDILACIDRTAKGKYRFTVLETKGDHLKGNDDTEYKRKLFGILTEFSNNCIPAGQLVLEKGRTEISFTMLLQENWQNELSRMIPSRT